MAKKIPRLFIPKKDSRLLNTPDAGLKQHVRDYGIDMRTIETWANQLPTSITTTPVAGGALWQWVSGRWYPWIGTRGTSLAAGSLSFLPFIVPVTFSSSTIGCHAAVQTTFHTTCKVRMGVYHDNGHFYPSTLIAQVGPRGLGNTTPPIDYVTALAVTLNPGIYWTAMAWSAPSIHPSFNWAVPAATTQPGSIAPTKYYGTSSVASASGERGLLTQSRTATPNYYETHALPTTAPSGMARGTSFAGIIVNLKHA